MRFKWKEIFLQNIVQCNPIGKKFDEFLWIQSYESNGAHRKNSENENPTKFL
jgi:hypothetical protein